MPMKQILLYNEDIDEHYIIIDPPNNLDQLLREWNALDSRKRLGDLYYKEVWFPVDEWLKTKGVDIVKPETIQLSSFDYYGD